MTSLKWILAGLVLGVATIGVSLLLPQQKAVDFFALLLFAIAAVYLGFAFLKGKGLDIFIELANFALMALFTFLGLWVAPFWIGIGLIIHGFWDVIHSSKSKLIPTEVPDWYIPFCMSYDWIIGLFIILWMK